MVFLFISGDSFIQTLFSDKYADSVIPFRWYLLLLPVRTVVFGSLLMAMNKTKVILVRAIGTLIINGILSVFLVKLFGSWGAVVATLITIYAWTVVYNVYTLSRMFRIIWCDFFPFKIWLKSFLFLVLPSCVLVGVLPLTKNLDSAYQLTIHAAVFGTFMIFWWNGKIYDLQMVKNTLNKINFKL
jgi:O-antigen/teichoic acid export membrane protein